MLHYSTTCLRAEILRWFFHYWAAPIYLSESSSLWGKSSYCQAVMWAASNFSELSIEAGWSHCRCLFKIEHHPNFLSTHYGKTAMHTSLLNNMTNIPWEVFQQGSSSHDLQRFKAAEPGSLRSNYLYSALMVRPITRRRISLVPPPISYNFASLRRRPVG